LSQGYAGEDDTKRPSNSKYYNIQDYPCYFIFHSNEFNNSTADIAADAATQGKSAENKQQVQPVYFPFALQFFKHIANVQQNFVKNEQNLNKMPLIKDLLQIHDNSNAKASTIG
jgi:predicted transcriptional regulator